MKHLAVIQSEFLRVARSWDDMTIDEQWAYLRSHPSSKRKLTAKPRADKKQMSKSDFNKKEKELTRQHTEALDMGDEDGAAKIRKEYKKLHEDYEGKKPETEAEQKVRKMIESGEEDTDSYERLLRQEKFNDESNIRDVENDESIEKGRQGFIDSLSNPYKKNTKEWTSWQTGYNEAKEYHDSIGNNGETIVSEINEDDPREQR